MRKKTYNIVGIELEVETEDQLDRHPTSSTRVFYRVL